MATAGNTKTKLILAKKGAPSKTFSFFTSDAANDKLMQVGLSVAGVLETTPESFYKQIETDLKA